MSLCKQTVCLPVAAVCAGVGVVRLVAAMISPYMPSLTAAIMAQLDLPEEAAQLTDELIKGAATPQVCIGGERERGKRRAPRACTRKTGCAELLTELLTTSWLLSPAPQGATCS